MQSVWKSVLIRYQVHSDFTLLSLASDIYLLNMQLKKYFFYVDKAFIESLLIVSNNNISYVWIF